MRAKKEGMCRKEEAWFAMRATYRRELKAKKLLEVHGIDSFVPMRYGITVRAGRKEKRLVPAIHNLIFVHSSLQRIREIKLKAPYLQYIMREDEQKQKKALIVPDRQMDDFIRLAQTYSERLVYMEPKLQVWEKGQRVRITDGPFRGQEGEFVKLAGIKGKSVVVSVSGVVAVAITTVPADCIEKIRTDETAPKQAKKQMRIQKIR